MSIWHHRQPHTAAEYRQEAERIRAMARQISFSEARDQLLDAAKRQEALAEKEERKAQHAAPHSEPKSEA